MIFKKDSETFLGHFKRKSGPNMEYLGTKITKWLIKGALKYLSEAAESRHNRSSPILLYVSFHFQ